MSATTVETVIQADGELHLSRLPVRKGDRVEAVISVLVPAANEDEREQARQRFLALARSSNFSSQGSYPTRDELHERH
jgi:hypothetical protein